jgi:Domain of Unknown Function (DUF928)
MQPIHLSKTLTIATVFTLTITNLLVVSAPTFSATPTEKSSIRSQKRLPVPPPSGRPGRKAGGGSRGQCPKVEIGATAIVPLAEATSILERPVLWFYSPYTETTPTAKFTLEQDGRSIAPPIVLQLPKTPGFVRVQLPETLMLNQSYKWFLAIDCSSKNTNSGSLQPPIELEGKLQRVSLNPPDRQKIADLSTNLQAQVDLYIANGLWLDAINTAMTLRRSQPKTKTFTTQWETMMRSLKLEELERIPLI